MSSLSVVPTLKLFYRHVREHKTVAISLFVAIVLLNLVEVFQPLVAKAFFDTFTSGLSASELVPSLTRVLFMMSGLFLAGWVFHRMAALLNNYFQPRLMTDLEQSAFDYLLGHSYRFFTNNFAGSLVRKVHRLSRAFENIADQIEWRLTQLIIATVGTLVIFYLRSPLIALVLGAWTIIFLIVNVFIARWKLKYDQQRAEVDSEMTGVLADAITNSITIQEFTGKEYEKSLFQRITEKWRKMQTFTWNLGEVNDAVQGFLMIALEFAALFFAIRLYGQGILTVGDFALIQTALVGLFMKLWDFGRVIRGLYEGFADAKEMVDIFNTPYEIKDKRGAKPLVMKGAEIGFKHVTFTYNKKKAALKNFSLMIEGGEKVAFVGPSGAGKSTIVKILLRFFDLSKGRITIDKQNIADVTQESLRENISLVPQDPLLFHRSLMENIRYGRREATDAEVMDAARRAHCDEFIQSLPDGYNTLVGERGIKLSGGERQRVAIARAILKNAPILILDEATSSLDSESESLIQDALRELMKNKTVIVIAHRLSTIMQMDRIVVIEKGTIADTGTHAELLRRVGTYRKLWNIQAGGFKA